MVSDLGPSTLEQQPPMPVVPQAQLAPSMVVPPIDLSAIAQIESSGGTNTVSAISKRDNSVGTYQVRPGVAKDYAAAHKVPMPDRNDPAVNETLANWYFQQEIPRLLTHYNVPVTTEHILAGYNMRPKGFADYFKKHGTDYSMLPSITAQYLKKYSKLTGGTDASLHPMS